jgi:glycosyltransferase involved in cell wall biosynthesis
VNLRRLVARLRRRLRFYPRADLRILILNWRCPTNPHAGGAEAFTFEVARRLVERGDSVEWFSASFDGAKTHETVDGIHIVRAGTRWSVHWNAFRRYRTTLSQRFDVVIDQVNTVPFFTPLWARIPTVMLIHQLAREVWWYESPFPLSLLGFVTEPLYLQVYRNRPILTVSPSTKADLIGLGFKGSVTIVPEGLEALSVVTEARSDAPTFLYVGRLAPSKRVSHVLKAFALFRLTHPHAQLRVIGEGSPRYVKRLRRLAAQLDLIGDANFLGRIPAREKHLEMARAHALILASAREGWGLVVTEANSYGTPAIAYDVPGLRDSIRHLETGLLVRPTPRSLADAMSKLWNDPTLFGRLSAAARSFSATFTFDRTTRAFQAGLMNAVSDKGINSDDVALSV